MHTAIVFGLTEEAASELAKAAKMLGAEKIVVCGKSTEVTFPKDQEWTEAESANIQTKIGKLKDRDRQVLTLVSRNMINREIAEVLKLSPPSVRNRIHSLTDMFGFGNRKDLAKLAKEHGLDQEPIPTI